MGRPWNRLDDRRWQHGPGPGTRTRSSVARRRSRSWRRGSPRRLAVGLVESFASFWSGALKDVIVFSLLIPVLMLRSFFSVHADEAEEEIDA